MTPEILTALFLAPFLIGTVIVLIGRPVESNIKLLIVLLPLQAFAAIEIGFTVTLSYLMLLAIIISILFKGDRLSVPKIGGKFIITYWSVALLATLLSQFDSSSVTTIVNDNMRYRAGSMRSVLQYGLLIFHFSLFFIIVNYVRTKDNAASLLKIHLWVGFVLFCLGISQAVSYLFDLPLADFTWAFNLIDHSSTIAYGKTRIYNAGVADFSTRTTFQESLHFADYLNSVIPLMLALWIGKSKELKNRFGFLVSPVAVTIGLLAMMFTFSRSGWGGLLLGIIIIVLWVSPKKALVHLPLAVSGMFAGLWVMMQIGFFKISDGSVWEIFTGRFELDKILMGPRAQYFLVLFDSFQEHPIFGLGAGQFALAAATKTGSDQVHSAHGILWAALGDFGLIGFFVLFGFLVSVLVALYKTIKRLNNNNEYRIILIGLFASLCSLYFQSLFVGDRIQFYLVFLLGISVVIIQQIRKENLNFEDNNIK